MIRLSAAAWAVVVEHLERAYPKEGCGILLGTEDEQGNRFAATAIACRNAYKGEQADRFELDPKEQIEAERTARQLNLTVVGIFHSHPDCDAYFSSTDLQYSCPWYSNVVVSVRNGRVHHAKAFLANFDQTESTSDELLLPDSDSTHHGQDPHPHTPAAVRR